MAEGGRAPDPAGQCGLSLDTMKSSRIVMDNWKMYEAYAQELRGLPGGYAANLSGICGYLMDLVESGGDPAEGHRQPGRCDCREAGGPQKRSGAGHLYHGRDAH